MNIDTLTLQTFIAIAETNSFTIAASKVSRTQSAVSQQIMKLESMLNKPLFIRDKKIQLTPEGELFLSYARQIFSLHKELEDRFKKPELEGELRFGLPENFASIYLSDIIADFSRIHPRIALNIECDLTLNLFEKFKKNDLDIVLLKMNRPEEFSDGINVWSEPLEWVGDKKIIQNEKPIPLVLAPSPCVYRAAAIKTLEKHNRNWRFVFSSNSYATVIAAVKAGIGITVMPKNMITDDLEIIDHKMIPKLPKTHLCLLKRHVKNPMTNTLEEFILKKLKHYS